MASTSPAAISSNDGTAPSTGSKRRAGLIPPTFREPRLMSRILIAGAGIGGLTAALALLRNGHQVQLYEQATELREVGAGVQLSANGTRVLIELGLRPAMQEIVCEPTGREIRLWNTGQSWKLFDLGETSVARYGAPYWMVHRGDFHAALRDAVLRAAPDAIRTGAAVTAFTQSEAEITLH